jgi:putative ABC transport system substrate-binding protein
LRRREFITLLGGAASTWPLATRAQQGERMRRIGWLDLFDENADEARAMWQALREWLEGRNLNIDQRFAAADVNLIRRYATELVSLAPDVLVTQSAATTRAIQQATQTILIVFTGGGDAVANGLVKNIARPEGNTTGFSSSELRQADKRLELLKQAAPQLSRIAIVVKPEVAPTAPNYIAAIEAAALTLSVETMKGLGGIFEFHHQRLYEPTQAASLSAMRKGWLFGLESTMLRTSSAFHSGADG